MTMSAALSFYFVGPMHHRPTPKTKRERLPKARQTGSSALKVEGGSGSRQLLANPPRRIRQGRVVSRLYTRIVVYLASSWIIVTAVRTFIFRRSTSDGSFGENISRHVPLYDQVYQLALDEESSQDNKKSHVADDDDGEKGPRAAFIGSSYGPNVTACSATVLFMDPRLGDPSYGPGQAAWFALESVAAFADHACVLLLTSSCTMKDHLEKRHIEVSDQHAEEAVEHAVYSKSLPLFREMIAQGRIRLSFLDTAKYSLKSCRDFGNPTAAFVHVDFWRDEFLDGIDSDLVLMMQDDAVLCTSLEDNLEDYRQYAYVGGVWPPKASKAHPNPPEGVCLGMAFLWKSWLIPQQRWTRFQKGLTKKPATEPDQLLETQFPAICEEGQGPVGNGGFSLRSRDWMVKAITTCPHVKLSGIDMADTTHISACEVRDYVNEDLYFGVVLRGLQAPMPSAVEAALFSVEMMFPEDAMDVYGVPPGNAEILSNSSRPQISDNEGRALTIPIGVHKPFWYHSNDLLRSKAMRMACPFLPYIFTPEMSRWQEFVPEKQWAGIGT
jgi:hypothetical protein